jgi:excinuclease ABC subunit A
LTVLTGVSGSGKSSLAIDTLFVEGRRRFVDSLSSGYRRLVGNLQRPDVDRMTGLPPTACIAQRRSRPHPRATLATVTELDGFLRLLFARAGRPHCPQCGRPIVRHAQTAIVESVLALPARTKVVILAPLIAAPGSKIAETLAALAKAGFVRARLDGRIVDVAESFPDGQRNFQTVEAVVDRLIVKDDIDRRVRESVATALIRGSGTCIISHADGDEWCDKRFTTDFACPDCRIAFERVEPRTFNPNSPYGACPECGGLGEATADESGSGIPAACPRCKGTRLNPLAGAVTFAGATLPALLATPLTELGEQLENVRRTLGDRGFEQHALRAAERLLPEIASRVMLLVEIGLGYLTLNRPAQTLSGGELQRGRLAACLGNKLTGICYVLDEPTAGLHASETERLTRILLRLRDDRNTLLVVDHSLEIIRSADYLIDVGPGAGPMGGRIVAAGSIEDLKSASKSLTAGYIEQAAADWRPVRDVRSHPALRMRGATRHNLKSIDVDLPLQALAAVAGVSGSGKSSLVGGTLVPALRASQAGSTAALPYLKQLRGVEHIERLVVAEANALGRNPRSNPATFSGIWDEIRKLLAATREARVRGFKPTRFSFNTKGGRCEACRGIGVCTYKMELLEDMSAPCPVCNGARFNRQTLGIRFKGRNVNDILNLTIAEALDVFENVPRLARTLDVFQRVGLGYLTLGQPADTLSGGEVQRMLLASELARGGARRTLFVLDEPTSGLHPHDVSHLVELLHELVEAGHSVLVVDHNLTLLRRVDWIVELGPEAGERGGFVVAVGPPHELAQRATPTARALARQS